LEDWRRLKQNCRTREGADGGWFLERRGWRRWRIEGLENERIKENWRRRG
jgi:hypothetical protein